MLATMGMALTVQTGSNYGIYQTGSGGEFTLGIDPADLLTYYSAATKGLPLPGSNPPNINTFQSFCLEGGETIGTNTIYNASISNSAILGGVGGEDPLSVGSAYLYTLFMSGNWTGTGTDYNYVLNRKVSANLFQKAIWWLEDEMGETYDENNPYEYLVYTKFGGEDGAKDDNFKNGFRQYHVQVLNLTKTTNGAVAQSQLVGAPTPEPVTLLLMGFGSGVMGVGIRRLRNRFRRKS